jgi:hypothetical protein
MRNALLTLTSLVVLATSAARADVYVVEGRDRDFGYGPNLLLVNPGDLLNGVLTLEYERALSPRVGITAGVSVWSFHGVFSPSSDPSYVAVGPEFGARVHFLSDAPGGLWIGPTISAGWLVSRSDGTVSRGWQWGLGAALGYNFIVGRHFTFQLGVGGRFIDYGDRLAWSPRLLLGLGSTF